MSGLMEDLYLDRLKELDLRDRKSMEDAMEDLSSMVNRPGKGREKKPLMTRRFPERKLNFLDILVFSLQSLNVADILYVFLISAAVALINMLLPYLNKEIFDNIIPSGETGNLLPIVVVLAASGAGAALFTVTRSLLMMRLRDKVNVDVQAAMIDRTFKLPASFFRKFSSGELSNRIMSVSSICSMLSDTVLSGILSLLFSLVYFYQVYVYAQSLLGICILLMSANILLSAATYACTLRFHRDIQPRSAALTGFLFSLVTGMQKIKTSGAERRAFARWASLFKEASPDKADKPLVITIAPTLSMVLSLGGTLLIYGKAFTSGVQLSDFIAFNVAFGMVSGAIASFNGILPTLAQLKPMSELVRPVLEEIPESEEGMPEVSSLSGAIEINELKFRYDDESPYLYDGLNLKIKAGEYVGIVGESGCGKSTLMRLLLGFEKPESGSIFYDHYNLANVNKSSLRRHIGTCMQDKNLFGGTIFDNITLNAPLSSYNDAWEAARLAGVDEDIREMPMRMHTLISDSGTGISGGQRQRILIARALAGKPSILFFDEATSALDNITQDKVAKNLDQMKCTRVCIAHRLSTIRSCDRILVLKGGKIIEEGTYASLMDRHGFFYELVNKQI